MAAPQQLMQQQPVQPHQPIQHSIQSQQPIKQQPIQKPATMSTSQHVTRQHHKEIVQSSQQQPTQQHSQQTSQLVASQRTSSSQLLAMSPPVTTTDTRCQSSPPLTSTPTGFTLSPPMNPPSVDSQYFSNIHNTSQDVSFRAINTPQFQPVDKASATQPDQPASGDQ